MQIISESEGLTNAADEHLVSLAQQGSEGAFGELVRRHNKTMLQVALRILGDRQDAEDELQNAWWKAWRHLSAFAGDSRFTTWLTRIVMNQCLMRLRQSRRNRFLYMDSPARGEERVSFELRDVGATPEQSVERQEVTDLVRREITRIPLILRQALVLREVEQLPMPDVADQLGISLAATKSRLLRARHELRNRLEKYCGRMGAATLAA